MSRWTHVKGTLELSCSPFLYDKEDKMFFVNDLTKITKKKFKNDRIYATINTYPIIKKIVDKDITLFDGGEFSIINDYFVNSKTTFDSWSSWCKDDDLAERLRQELAPSKKLEDIGFSIKEIDTSVLTLSADIRYQNEEDFCIELDHFLQQLRNDDIWIERGHFTIDDEYTEHIIEVEIDMCGNVMFMVIENGEMSIIKEKQYKKEGEE